MTPIIKHPRKGGVWWSAPPTSPLSLPRLTNWQPLPMILVKSTMVRINIRYRWIWKIWTLRQETYALPPFFMNPKHSTGIVKIYMNMNMNRKVINSNSNKLLYNTYYIQLCYLPTLFDIQTELLVSSSEFMSTRLSSLLVVSATSIVWGVM